MMIGGFILLIIPGLIGLIRAMSGQDYRYPMIGKSLGKSLGKRLLGP